MLCISIGELLLIYKRLINLTNLLSRKSHQLLSILLILSNFPVIPAKYTLSAGQHEKPSADTHASTHNCAIKHLHWSIWILLRYNLRQSHRYNQKECRTAHNDVHTTSILRHTTHNSSVWKTRSNPGMRGSIRR